MDTAPELVLQAIEQLEALPADDPRRRATEHLDAALSILAPPE